MVLEPVGTKGASRSGSAANDMIAESPATVSPRDLLLPRRPGDERHGGFR